MTTNKDVETDPFSDTTNQRVIIKRCNLDDLDGVIKVNEEELPEDYPYFFYKSILDNFPESFLLAQNDQGKIVGYI